MISNPSLNINVGAADVVSPTNPTGSPGAGLYSSSVNQAVAGFNQVMMKQAEHFDPFIQKSLIAHPRFW